MKKNAIFMITAISLFFFYSCLNQTKNEKAGINLKIDGSKEFQQIDGVGVNANTASWNGEELKPALDLLIDSMHASIWRVIVETMENWEEVNDNDDPFDLNWNYYNKLYATSKFQKAWEMIQYLNNRGITDKLMINFMGFAPQWMGIKIIKPEFEDEFVEMLASFFHYAVKTRHLKIGLISISNENDLGRGAEGPYLDGKQYARILRKFIDRMSSLGIMEGIGIVAPDIAIQKNATEFIPPLINDPVIKANIAHLGLHSYSGFDAQVKDFLNQPDYSNHSFWFTEWNAWCNGCDDGELGEYNYDFAAQSVEYLLDFFKNGASAALVWEGYDSYYEHHAPSPFSYWGMLAYDASSKTYSPRKNLYAIQHVSKFVEPGSSQIAVNGADSSLVVLAFLNKAKGRMIITGVNTKNQPVTINGELANLSEINSMEFYYTDSEKNLHKDKDIVVNREKFTKIIPAKCIFTFTGKAENN